MQGPLGVITYQTFGLSFPSHTCGLDPSLFFLVTICEVVSLVAILRESTQGDYGWEVPMVPEVDVEPFSIPLKGVHIHKGTCTSKGCYLWVTINISHTFDSQNLRN
jgi:hypothetical protein